MMHLGGGDGTKGNDLLERMGSSKPEILALGFIVLKPKATSQDDFLSLVCRAPRP